MKNILKTIVSLTLISGLVVSCSTSSELANNSPIKKRRYTKGFHVDFKKNQKVDRMETMASIEIEKSNSELAKPESHNIKGFEAMADAKSDILEISALERSYTKSDNARIVQSEVFEFTPEEFTSNRERKREIKNAIKEYKALQNPAAVSGEPQWLYYVLAIIIPPLGIGLLYGITLEFWISLVLTLLFWLPGAIYSLIMTLKYYGEM